MILTIDAGNTNICCGVFDGDELRLVFRVKTDRSRTADQYAAELYMMLTMRGLGPSDFDGAVIGSVVPELNRALTGAAAFVTGTEPMEVAPGVKTGVNIRIDDPATLGADLLAGAVGAAAEYPLPCLIADLGTATKLTVVDRDRAFRGGVIAPGVKMSLNALSGGTSKLPAISLDTPKRAIGTNTVDCMRAGSVLGTAAMLDGMIDRLEDELGEPFATLIATGGIARHIIGCCRREMTYDPHLLLKGLKAVWERNR